MSKAIKTMRKIKTKIAKGTATRAEIMQAIVEMQKPWPAEPKGGTE